MTKKEKYKLFCKKEKDLPVFLKYEWWNIITDGEWDIAISEDKNENIKAFMPFHLKKVFGFNFILQPEFTPYSGIYYLYPKDLIKNTSKYSFQNKNTTIIINQLPKNIIYQQYKFLPQIDNWYPFYKMGYEQSTRYTFILDDIKNHESIFAGFTNTLKRQLKEAEKKYTIIEIDNPKQVFNLMLKSLHKKNIKIKTNYNKFKALDKYLGQNNMRNIFIAKDKHGKTTAGLYLVRDIKKAYLLGLGTDYSENNNQSTKLLIYESIKAASRYVDIYDFEGSMIEGVERLYKSFGGKKESYFELKKYNNRIIKAIFALVNK